MKQFFNQMLDSGKYISFMAPVVLVIALLSVVFAMNEVSHVIRSGGQFVADSMTKKQTPVLTKHNLNKNGYVDAANVIGRLNPAVRILVGKDENSLSVSIADPELMPEWVFALSTISSYGRGMLWNSEKMCLKKCDGGAAAEAEIRAYTQDIEVN